MKASRSSWLHRIAMILSVLVASASAAPATAQQAAALGSPHTLKPRHATIFGELGVGSIGNSDPSFTALTFGLGARAVVAAPFALSLDWSFAEVSGSGRDSVSAMGNPLFMGHFLLDAGPGVVDLGFGVAAPAMDNDLESLVAASGGIAIHGAQDPWLYVVNAVPLVFQIRSAFDLRGARLAADGALGVYLPTEDGDVRTSLQMGLQVGPVFGPVEVGFRIQAMIQPDGPRDDEAQFSMGPYVHAEFGVGFLGAMMLMNLDKPYGFAFDDGGVWGLIMTGGAAF